MLEEIAKYLAEQGLGVVGQSIFVEQMPAGKPGLLLRGKVGGDDLDPYVPDLVKSTVTIISRTNSYADGKQLIDGVVTAIKEGFEHRRTLGGIEFRRVWPRTTPGTFPPLQGYQREFAVSLEVLYVDIR